MKITSISPRPDWNAIWDKANRQWAIRQQEENLEKLHNKEPEAVARFLSDWDDAILLDQKITALRNRTEEEVEKAKEINRKKVEKNRWQWEPVRSPAQLVEDGRRIYRADMPALYHMGEHFND